jgi:hypothetical protein
MLLGEKAARASRGEMNITANLLWLSDDFLFFAGKTFAKNTLLCLVTHHLTGTLSASGLPRLYYIKTLTGDRSWLLRRDCQQRSYD